MLTIPDGQGVGLEPGDLPKFRPIVINKCEAKFLCDVFEPGDWYIGNKRLFDQPALSKYKDCINEIQDGLSERDWSNEDTFKLQDAIRDLSLSVPQVEWDQFIDQKMDSLNPVPERRQIHLFLPRFVCTCGKTLPGFAYWDAYGNRFRNDNHTAWYESCLSETVRKTINNWQTTNPTLMNGCPQCKPDRYRTFRNSYVWMDYLSQEEIRCRCESCTM